MPPTKNASGLGKALINRKHKEAQQRRETGNYTTDTDPTTKLQSVTQERDLDEFLNTAQLANTDFTAEKQNIRVIQAPDVGVSSAHNPFLLSAQDEEKALQRHFENKARLRVPRRSPWTKDMTPVQLDRQEKDAFLEWRRGLADLSDKEGFLLTPFERNIEVWRQLWRVLERSQLVVQIVDARNPLRFRCEDLEAYVGDIEGSEGEKGTGKGKRRTLLLINKADLLTRTQRKTWADYFDANNVRFAFYSAANASALQELENQTEGQGGGLSEDQPPDSPEAESDEGSQNSDNSRKIEESEEQESDPRIRVLTVRELEELFVKSAPPLTDFVDSTGKPPEKLVVGLVGYPNVGKSSTINSLIGAKKVSVSSTPGKTKHFQTIQLTPTLVLCDCPGLVFPQFATTKAELVCDGVLPIDQMREYRGPVGLVTKRISRAALEAVYGLTLRKREATTMPDDEVSAEDLLVAYAIARGYARAGQGNPDEARAARYILKDYVNAKLLYCHPPPDISGKEFNIETMEIQLRMAIGTKKAPVTRVGKNADTAPDVFYDDENQDQEDQEDGQDGQPKPAVHQSGKSRALDRDFFNSQAIGSRPFVKGGGRDGQAFSRVKLYPHQNSVSDDGTPLNPHQANAAAILESSGIGGGPGKKHFKVKRAKQRSGKGYD